jgi:hypothetical protein
MFPAPKEILAATGLKIILRWTRWLISTGHGLVSTGSSSQDATIASVGGRRDVGKSWRNDTIKSEPFML